MVGGRDSSLLRLIALSPCNKARMRRPCLSFRKESRDLEVRSCGSVKIQRNPSPEIAARHAPRVLRAPRPEMIGFPTATTDQMRPSLDTIFIQRMAQIRPSIDTFVIRLAPSAARVLKKALDELRFFRVNREPVVGWLLRAFFPPLFLSFTLSYGSYDKWRSRLFADEVELSLFTVGSSSPAINQRPTDTGRIHLARRMRYLGNTIRLVSWTLCATDSLPRSAR